MSTLAHTLPKPTLVLADLLKIRRRRGLLVVTAVLTVGAVVLAYGITEVLHLVDPAKYGPAGGVPNLGRVAFLLGDLGSVAAVVVAAIMGTGDLESGVYRDLVVTGRSRLALYLSRIPAGLSFVLAFVAAGYALAVIASVVFAGKEPAPSVHTLTTTGLWVLLSVTFYYLLAYGVACVLGSRSYTIGVVLAWRLALTPLLASLSALGVARELVPGVVLQSLSPGALGTSATQGPVLGVSAAAAAAVLTVWTLVALVAGAWRDTSRDA
jgi:ABC-type transport system involved in multi-copper enzyme maturation permease subunit